MQKQTLRSLALLSAAAALAACGDSNGPGQKPVASVEVSGVRLDPTTFRTSAEFGLGVVALDAEGRSLLNAGTGDVKVEITGVSASLMAPAGPDLLASMAAADCPSGQTPTASTVAVSSDRPNSSPIAAALDIDESGSMGTYDPQNLRATAAQAFWRRALPNTQNEVALVGFGGGVSSGFSNTRVLANWTRDTSVLNAQVGNIRSSGSTPLYESALEVLAWVDTAKVSSKYRRVFVLMTDGQPNSDSQRQAVLAKVQSTGITVHAVGLGPASDLSSSRSTAAVLRLQELTNASGGVYASAESPQQLDALFRTLSTVATSGQLVPRFRLSCVPSSGQRVNGRVTVTSGGQSRSANFAFVVP